MLAGASAAARAAMAGMTHSYRAPPKLSAPTPAWTNPVAAAAAAGRAGGSAGMTGGEGEPPAKLSLIHI